MYAKMTAKSIVVYFETGYKHYKSKHLTKEILLFIKSCAESEVTKIILKQSKRFFVQEKEC
jgi:hypothetical protein